MWAYYRIKPPKKGLIREGGLNRDGGGGLNRAFTVYADVRSHPYGPSVIQLLAATEGSGTSIIIIIYLFIYGPSVTHIHFVSLLKTR